jgi:cytochrome c oxidase subunit 1
VAIVERSRSTALDPTTGVTPAAALGVFRRPISSTGWRSWLFTVDHKRKEHDFDALPEVHSLDEFFHRKYEDVGEGDVHDLRRVATAEEILAEQEAHADHHIHMPSPSYWPIIVAFALPIVAVGIIYNPLISIVGAVLLVIAVFGWALEPSVAPESHYDPSATGPDVGTTVAAVSE